MVYFERNLSTLSKLVAVEKQYYSLSRPTFSRCMGSLPRIASNLVAMEKSSDSLRLPTVTRCMGSSPRIASKLVAVEKQSYSLSLPTGTRCLGLSPVQNHFEKSHKSHRPLVGPDLYVMGTNPGASQKTKSQVSLDLTLSKPQCVMGSNPGDVKTQNQNLTGHSSCVSLFFVQTSNLNVMGSSSRTLLCSKS